MLDLKRQRYFTADITNLFRFLFRQAGDDSKKLFLDCGANIVYYSMYALAAGFHVIAVEPQWRAMQKVRMLAAANG